MTTEFEEVTKDAFYKVIGPLSVDYFILPGGWPYTGEFRTPSGQVRGKKVGVGNELKEGLQVFKYYLPKM